MARQRAKDREFTEGRATSVRERSLIPYPEKEAPMPHMLKLTLLAAMAVIATAAHAQQNTRNFYNSRGAFAGIARTHGNATTFTDKHGRFVGSAVNRGNGMALYDRHGNFTRSMVRQR
jgi:hypothetical protein